MELGTEGHPDATNTLKVKIHPLLTVTEKQAEKLGLYVGLASRPPHIEQLPKQTYQPPYFFFEIAPDCTANCAYAYCSSKIYVRDYRVAVCPGMPEEPMLLQPTETGAMISTSPLMAYIADTLL